MPITYYTPLGNSNSDVIINDSIYHKGNDITRVRFPSNNIFTIETNNAERLRVDASGNLGIGTSSPGTKLDVAGTLRLTSNIADLNYTADIYARYDSGHPFQIDVKNNGFSQEYFGVYADSGGSNNRVVFPNGNVGVGLTNPQTKLEVRSGGAYTGTKLITLSREEPDRYNAFLGFGDYAGGNKFGLQLGTRNNNVDYPTLTMVDGNVGIGTTSPSVRLDIADSARSGTNNLSGTVFYATSNVSDVQYIGQFRHANQSQGIGFSYNTIRQTGSNVNEQINLASRGNGNLNLRYGSTDASLGTIGLTLLGTNGNVGIGTSSPNQKLDVRGYIVSDVLGTGQESGFYLGNSSHGIRRNTTTNDVYVYTTSGTLYLGANGSTTNQITILNGGNVGIGTASPTHKLHVNGSIRHNGVLVNAAGVKTYSISTAQQGNVSRIYEIMRISKDHVNWSVNIPYEITAYCRYYLPGGVTRWTISYGYFQNARITCVDARGSGQPRVYLGTEVVVSGNIRYVPVLVDIPPYVELSIEVKYNTTEVTTINASSQVQFTDTYTTGGSGAFYNGNVDLVPDGGNVGIGTTSPNTRLSVQTSGANGIALLQDTGTTVNSGRLFFQASGGTYSIINGSNILQFSSGATIGSDTGTARMVLNSSGNVGIGTTSPVAKLDVRVNNNSTQASQVDGFTLRTNQGNGIEWHLNHTNGYQGWVAAARVNNNGNNWGQAYLEFITAGSTGGNQVSVLTLHGNGNVSIGSTAVPTYKLQVNGSFAAKTKSFVIDHPTRPGKKLQHGSLEGPEHGVYIRGKLNGTVIELPEYWTKLVDSDSITVQLTSIETSQKLYVHKIEDNKVYVKNENQDEVPYCFYFIQAERIDIKKIEVEID